MTPLIFILATFPHTGNNWIRNIWELGTGIGSEAYYKENGLYSNVTHSYGSSCGNDAGRRHRRQHGLGICNKIHRAEPGEPVLIKTHWPSFRSLPEQEEHFDELSGIILTIRDHISWCDRYFDGGFNHKFNTIEGCYQGTKTRFRKHNEWWIKRYPYVPVHIYNYTMMKYDKEYTQECLEEMMHLTGAKLIRDPFIWYPGKDWVVY